jgi:hypothetical protein
MAGSAAVVAQEVTPVWVQHLNGLVNVAAEDKIPILQKAGGTSAATYGFSGRDVIDSYVSFTKYDDDRYLLGIRENGINEDDPGLSQELKDRAAAFPDRSIIWIDARTGKSLGVALRTEILPVPLAAPDQAPVHAWWKFGVQDGPNGQRAIYTGYKYKVLRYAPAGTVDDPNFPGGRPTWSATPTEAWVEPVPGEPSGDESSGGDGSASWRLKFFRVSGAGNQTQLWIGGASWRASMHPQQLVTTDGGLTFQPVARMDDRDSGGEKGTYSLGGQPSSIVTTPADPARPGLEISYQGHYPGTGWEARPNRYTKNPQGDGTPPRLGGTGRPDFFERDEAAAGGLPEFRWEAAGKDGIPINHRVDGVEHYDGNWVLTSDTKNGLEYLVTYAIPSWNQVFGAVGNPDAVFKPGWIGVHTLDGRIASGASSYKIPVYETDEPIDGNNGTGHDYGYDGDLNVYPVAGADPKSGKALVLWAGGSYGFGVFQVEATPATVVSSPASVQVDENQQVTLSATVSGSPNKYQWTRNGTDLVVTNENYRVSLTEGADKAILTILKAQVADSGEYALKVTNPFGNVTSTPATLTVVSDNTAPTLRSVSAGKSPSTSYLVVEFSEPVTAESAGLAGNYRLSGGAVIASVTVSSPTRVSINTSALTSGTAYTLTVNGVRDVSANANVIAADSTASVTVPGLNSGFLLWELYSGVDGTGIDGTAVDALTGDGSYPDLAARREILSSFTTAPSLNNVADRFGARISGWLTPTESGSYRFFIRSDDASQLLISANADPDGAGVVAEEFGCCQAFLEPTNAEGTPNTQTSEPIQLVAGQSYYIAAIYKEGGGGDFCEVAWRKEGDATPAASLTPIPGSFFKSYVAVASEFEAIEATAGGVRIRWTGSGRLQESSDLSTWTDVAGSPSSPYTATVAAGGAKFFRLAQ